MATETKTINILKKRRTKTISSFKNAHAQVLDITEGLVEGAIESGTKYQRLTAKLIKKSEPIVEKQIDIMFDTIEEVYKQYNTGNKKLLKLLGITKQVKKAKSDIKSTVKKTSVKIEKNVDSLKSAAEKTVKTVRKEIKEAAEAVGMEA